ncbi:MAG: cyclic 2,3-diphosphoglycerate synthase [Nitrospirota bacterium]
MERVIILGAGGRDFHNFNTFFRDNSSYRVVAFTAAQIPFIENRIYPPELAGRFYPDGIPIYPEEELLDLITENRATKVVFSYSDVSYEELMHMASKVIAHGADFLFLGPGKTMIESKVPVISVCAVRTGCGKSAITRKLATIFKELGIRVSVIRHPMVYSTFEPVLGFSNIKDLDKKACTIEEREEFEPLVKKGITVYAGVDYKQVVRAAEFDSEVIIWDGGNNDFPFVKPDMEVVLLDAMRPGHETSYWPGEVNLRRGNLYIITKVNEARKSSLKRIRNSIYEINPEAEVIEAPSIFTVTNPKILKGKKVLIIEDGPSITHGGIAFGAGASASRGIASKLVDPRPYAVGSIRKVYEKYPHIGRVLPAMGYSQEQIKELEETIKRVDCDVVVIATPVDLRKIMKINKQTVKVSYDFVIDLSHFVNSFVEEYIEKGS